MFHISKLVFISLTVFYFHVEAVRVTPPETIPNEKQGCPRLNPLIRCIQYLPECDTETNQPCSGTQICCPNECGSSCKVPDYIKPSPIRGCPSYDSSIICIWFNEQCNEIDKPCPRGSICCGDNCGTQCVEQKSRCKPSPVKGCPAIDTFVRCAWYNNQCNAIDKPCPADSICCENSCGTSCIKRRKPAVCTPKPTKGCPPVDPKVVCVWYNEQCNETDKRCPAGSICCGNNCGTFCFKQ